MSDARAVARLLLALSLPAACSRQTQPDPVTTAPPATTTTAANGSLDCDTDEVFTKQATVLPTAGARTPEQELKGFLSQWVARFGGEISVYGERSAALVVGGKEPVIAVTSAAPAGGWIVLTTRHCAGYRL